MSIFRKQGAVVVVGEILIDFSIEKRKRVETRNFLNFVLEEEEKSINNNHDARGNSQSPERKVLSFSSIAMATMLLISHPSKDQ